jgi:hypothetical protein
LPPKSAACARRRRSRPSSTSRIEVLHSRCKKCHRKEMAEYAKTSETLKAWRREWDRKNRATPKYKLWRREYSASRRGLPQVKEADKKNARVARSRWPEKAAARRFVRNAVVAGELKKPESCSMCGVIGPVRRDGVSAIQAHHHNGYDKPLDVVWLCIPCHVEADRNQK